MRTKDKIITSIVCGVLWTLWASQLQSPAQTVVAAIIVIITVGLPLTGLFVTYYPSGDNLKKYPTRKERFKYWQNDIAKTLRHILLIWVMLEGCATISEYFLPAKYAIFATLALYFLISLYVLPKYVQSRKDKALDIAIDTVNKTLEMFNSTATQLKEARELFEKALKILHEARIQHINGAQEVYKEVLDFLKAGLTTEE